jgi:hypothetical protein
MGRLDMAKPELECLAGGDHRRCRTAGLLGSHRASLHLPDRADHPPRFSRGVHRIHLGRRRNGRAGAARSRSDAADRETQPDRRTGVGWCSLRLRTLRSAAGSDRRRLGRRRPIPNLQPGGQDATQMVHGRNPRRCRIGGGSRPGSGGAAFTV